MSKRFSLGAGLFAAVLTIATTAAAHHGWSSYDASKVMKPTGRVLASSWGSPHGEVAMTIEGKRWAVVLAPVLRMEARGLVKADVAAGKTVTVEGYPRSDGTLEMRVERITVGAKTVELR
jgi:hypothetical protein